jgi:hypothetical protein
MDTFIGEAGSDTPGAGFTTPGETDERVGLPLALKIILLSCFLPDGLSFFVAGLRLTVTRLTFLVLTPVVFARFAQKVSTGRYRFVASDVFVPAAGAWMFLGPSVLYGVSDTLVHSGPIVLEYLIAYMATRVLVEENGQALSFVSLLCAVIAVVCLDAALDTLTGRYFTKDLVFPLSGIQTYRINEDNFRYGLLRAAGPIEHPILFGLVAGIGLLFAAWTKIRLRGFCIAACGLGVIICFSSAPEQCVLMGFGLMIYGKLMAGMKTKWLLVWGAIAAVVVPVFLMSNSPFGFLFDFLTIDSATAYYRLYIWNMVGPPVLQSPYFGVYSDNIDYEGSVDSLWLVLSMLYGMPCAILVGLSMIGACSLPTGAPRAYLTEAESRVGTVLGIVMVLIIYMGFTVHLWGSAWILVGLLTGLRARLGELGWLNRRAFLESAPTA